MEKHLHVAFSQKYVARQIAIVPTEEGLVVFHCHGSERGLVGTFDAASLERWLVNEHASALRRILDQPIRKAPLDFDPLASLDFKL